MFQRMLGVLAMLGVVFGPVSIGVAESAMAASASMSVSNSMPDMHMSAAETETAGAADDMPCCPKAQPVAPDCQKNCPLALICASMVFVHPLQLPSGDLALPLAISFRVSRDASLASAVPEPPARPPRA